MALTSIKNDPIRTLKELQQKTFVGRYMLNVPGPGINTPYFEDPQIRIQAWGANTWTDSTNLESEFRGLGKKLDRHYNIQPVEKGPFQGRQLHFGSSSELSVDESRATHPAWMYRNPKVERWDIPLHNPQSYLEKPVQFNMNTRIQVKDQFRGGRR